MYAGCETVNAEQIESLICGKRFIPATTRACNYPSSAKLFAKTCTNLKIDLACFYMDIAVRDTGSKAMRFICNYFKIEKKKSVLVNDGFTKRQKSNNKLYYLRLTCFLLRRFYS